MSGLLNEFFHPDARYSPFPFWFLNGDLEDGEIARQLRDFCDKGVMGVVLHPRIGVPARLAYLSDAFLDKICFAVKTAKQLGMKVLLYDEGMYPSGSAHGLVVKENPDFAAKGIRMLAKGEAPREGERVWARIAVQMTGNAEYAPESARELLDGESARPGETEIRIAAGFTRGTIRGIHPGEDDGQPGAPAAGDLLNARAMRAFLRITHEAYYARLGDEFGKTILGIFTDEPSPTGRAGTRGMRPWTEGFDADMESAGLTRADLPALWLACAGREADVRARYGACVTRRLIQTYYSPIAEWCASRGIALCGHPDSPQESEVLRYFHIPGQDIVWRWVAPENDLGLTGKESAQAKCASDIARHMGRERNLNECFGCCGPAGEMWALAVDDIKWYLDWLFARGCNMVLPHAFFYALNTPVQMDRPPDVGPNNIWWPYFAQISGYIRRMCMLNTGGVNGARLAVLGTGERLPVDEVRALYEGQIEFNYLTDKCLVSLGRMEDGCLRVADQRYEALLICEGFPFDSAALARAKQFQAQGLRLLRASSRAGAYKTARFSGDARALRVSLLARGGAKLLLVFNEGEKAYRGRATLPFAGEIMVLNAWTGKAFRASAPGGHMEIALGRREGVVFVSGEDASGLPEYELPAPVKRARSLDALWRLRLPDGREIAGLADWQTISGMELFAGECAYVCEFRLQAAPERAALDLGNVREIARVRVNGRDLGALLRPPYRADVSGLLQKGINRAEITVTNALVPKYAGKPWPGGMLGPTRLILYK